MRCRLVDENGQIGQRVIADLWTDALKPKQVGGGRTIYFTNYTCGHHTHETCWLWGGELGGGGRPETRSGQDCALHVLVLVPLLVLVLALVLVPLLVLVLALVLGPSPVHQLATWDLGQPVMQGQER